MTKYERYKDFPHFDLVRENETIVIPSIFMFNNNEDFYPFLAACRDFKCTVFFENEQLTIPPDGSIEKTIEVLCYAAIMNCRKIGDDYVRYLGNLARMQWEAKV
jgi:hypothetical protein